MMLKCVTTAARIFNQIIYFYCGGCKAVNIKGLKRHRLNSLCWACARFPLTWTSAGRPAACADMWRTHGRAADRSRPPPSALSARAQAVPCRGHMDSCVLLSRALRIVPARRVWSRPTGSACVPLRARCESWAGSLSLRVCWGGGGPNRKSGVGGGGKQEVRCRRRSLN